MSASPVVCFPLNRTFQKFEMVPAGAQLWSQRRDIL